ncbi:hypothetical protein DICSQDRAFT_57843 [Dichomitus squalens LYAD-421 SS1]|uniref:Uncharacterized protein n=1 Tax=Dichomitus squalens TaxID=114155 RepID=A0A4Q9MFA6_9APHY|nr:uncharacterized protein DICSQDRAFT_57843 [Dichomitus squalens LYAD-421 SS1]EJF62652.1 hypothetical protein DICSQDRAFT_57843 [Dichomitus squalens LYAD-421 SS1]TBU26044.1 hypothetical protein BD311DRAFT_668323 [Dichomitus squalens]
MAPTTEAQRPAMRRKSSAQNLLSGFKVAGSNPSSSAAGGAPPSSFPASSAVSIPGLPYPSAAPTPTTATMPGTREWDVQSLQSDGVNSAAGSAIQTNGSIPQGTSVEFLRELVKKRIITLTYLRNVHEGRSHWFHTIMITRAELDRAFTNAAMKQRTYRFAVLGMALANQFDVKEPQDLLRGLSNVLTEYELLKEDTDKPRIRLFRPKGGTKRLPGVDYALTYTDPSEAYMSLPHVPFPLDYHQTLLSLLDVLSELYNKISKILGPSPFSHAGNSMMGPLGLLSPHPGVSYLFSGAEAASVNDGDSSLWGIAHASTLGSATGPHAVYGGGPGSPPPSWTSTLGDTVRQIDNKLKKLIATLLKELDDCARAGIKDELASLDPLLRHVSGAGEPRDTFEFD